MRFDASSTSDPNDCVNAFARSLQPSRRIASLISACVRCQSRDAVGGTQRAGEIGRARQRDPAHQLRVDEVPGFAPHLPDAMVLLLPAPRGGVGEPHEEAAGAGRQGRRSAPVAVVGLGTDSVRGVEHVVRQPVHRVEQLSVHVQLPLTPGAVAHTHGRGVAPTREVRELALGEVVFAADAEHDLQVAVSLQRSRGRRGHVLEEFVGLVGARRDPQRLDGERRVPDPREPVVPVPFAALAFWERRGGGGADRAGWLERQRLEHASALVHEVVPRAFVGLVQLRPRLPRRDRCRRAAPRSRPGSRCAPRRRRPASCGATRSPALAPAGGRTVPRRPRSGRA